MTDKVWRFAVIGLEHMHAGDQIAIARKFDGLELVGIWDTDPQRLARFGAELAINQELLFTDLAQLVAEAAPEVAAVCSTTADHRWISEVLAAAGIHILLEKPFAASLDDAVAMIDATAATGVTIGVNWPLAWYPSHRTLHRILQEGGIGDVTEVHYYDGNRGPLFHTHGKAVIEPEQARSVKETSWWYDPERGGGSLRDYLGYGATLATWFRDGELPQNVLTKRFLRGDDRVDEQSVTIAEYSSGLSTFQTRWGTFTDPWNHQPAPKCGFVVVGTRGTATSWDYDEFITVQTEDAPDGEFVPVDSLPEHEQSGLRNLIFSLERGEALVGPISPEVSLAGQRIVEASALSSSAARTVALSELQ